MAGNDPEDEPEDAASECRGWTASRSLDVLRSYLCWAEVPVAILTAYPEDPRLWHVGEKGVRRVFAKSRASLGDVLAWVDRVTRPVPPQLAAQPDK